MMFVGRRRSGLRAEFHESLGLDIWLRRTVSPGYISPRDTDMFQPPSFNRIRLGSLIQPRPPLFLVVDELADAQNNDN